MFLLMALPEFLPTERRRLAGAARIVAFGYASFVVAYALLWY